MVQCLSAALNFYQSVTLIGITGVGIAVVAKTGMAVAGVGIAKVSICGKTVVGKTVGVMRGLVILSERVKRVCLSFIALDYQCTGTPFRSFLVFFDFIPLE